MALKRLKNGTFKVETKAQAVEALSTMVELSEAISELEKDVGIDEMRMDAVELKKAATNFLAEKEIAELEIPKKGKVAKLIQAATGIWVTSKKDLPKGAPSSIKPLRTLITPDEWKQISKRTLDPDKLAEAVATGLLDEEKISAAYYEKLNAPYVRLFDDG